jgi:hypothetical protein
MKGSWVNVGDVPMNTLFAREAKRFLLGFRGSFDQATR